MDERKNYENSEKHNSTDNILDTDSDYILSTQKHLTRDNSRLPDYGDGFDNQLAADDIDGSSSDYILSTQKHLVEDKSRLSDYGDDFDSQTGEDNSGYAYSIDKDIYSNSLSPRQNKNKKKIRASKVCAIVFIVFAIICLVIATVFVLTRCTDDKPIIHQKPTDASTTVQAATYETYYQAEPTEYQPQTEAAEPPELQPEVTEPLQTQKPEASDTTALESSVTSEPTTEAGSEFVPPSPEADPEEILDGEDQNAIR